MKGFFVALAGASLASGGAQWSRLIVALGDSTTAGTPYFSSPLEAPPSGRGDARAPYPYWLERELAGWKVLNRGVAGERTDEIRARFDRDVVAARPKYVMILAGVNDVYQDVPLKAIEANLAWMYSRAKENKIVPIAASVLPFDKATTEQSERIDSLNAWIAMKARRLDVPYCDLHAASADPKNRKRLAGSQDGMHPDRSTYQALGRAAARTVVALEKKSP